MRRLNQDMKDAIVEKATQEFSVSPDCHLDEKFLAQQPKLVARVVNLFTLPAHMKAMRSLPDNYLTGLSAEDYDVPSYRTREYFINIMDPDDTSHIVALFYNPVRNRVPVYMRKQIFHVKTKDAALWADIVFYDEERKRREKITNEFAHNIKAFVMAQKSTQSLLEAMPNLEQLMPENFFQGDDHISLPISMDRVREVNTILLGLTKRETVPVPKSNVKKSALKKAA